VIGVAEGRRRDPAALHLGIEPSLPTFSRSLARDSVGYRLTLAGIVAVRTAGGVRKICDRGRASMMHSDITSGRFAGLEILGLALLALIALAVATAFFAAILPQI
jgi:hypothetical protein